MSEDKRHVIDVGDAPNDHDVIVAAGKGQLQIGSDNLAAHHGSDRAQVDRIKFGFTVVDDEIGLRNTVGGLCPEDEGIGAGPACQRSHRRRRP